MQIDRHCGGRSARIRKCRFDLLAKLFLEQLHQVRFW